MGPVGPTTGCTQGQRCPSPGCQGVAQRCQFPNYPARAGLPGVTGQKDGGCRRVPVPLSPRTRASPLGEGAGGVPGRLPSVGQQGRGGTEAGRRWRRASSANPNLIFPGPTPVSMETAGSRNGNQNPEMRSLELPFAFLDSRSLWPRDAGWVLATGHPRCSHHAGVQGRPVLAPRGVGVLLCPCTPWHPCTVHGTWGCARCAQQCCAVGRGYRGQGVPRAGGTAGRDIAGSTVHGQVQATSAHICASRWCARVGV